MWSPTIALSWLWGLGFFYAIHVTFLYGLPGFLAFAVPNAGGLALFGWGVERFAPRTALDETFARLSARYGGILIVYQVVAVAITVCAFALDYLHPLIGPLAIPLTVLIALVACAVGHVLRVRDFRALHASMLVLGVGAALAALMLMPATTSPHLPAAPGLRLYGLVLPSLVGFLLGPWLDLQQWQRALRVREEGGSIACAYAGGGLLFFCLIGINAVFAASLPAAAAAALHPGADGVVEAQAVLAGTLAAAGPAAAPSAWLFGIWGAIAVASTLDSAYAATRWHLVSTTTRSASALFALLPKTLVQSPLWMLGAGLAVAGLAYATTLPLMLMIVPFCSLFVGYAACLALQIVRLQAGRHDPMLCFLLGIAAAAGVAVSYYGQVVAMSAASLLPLLATVTVLRQREAASPSDAGTEAVPVSSARPGPARPAVPEQTAPAAPGLPAGEPATATGLGGRFDGNWFLYDVMPTYDDTNSVGNVYFANYIRWVGKTRELFFAKCVPNFDLKTTGFFILTRDFYHKFVRETREFEAMVVRIRVGKHNRKFVTLEHEIRGAGGDLLGKGSQQLMFVDVASYNLIDVPVDMLRGFIPYVSNVPAGVS